MEPASVEGVQRGVMPIRPPNLEIEEKREHSCFMREETGRERAGARLGATLKRTPPPAYDLMWRQKLSPTLLFAAIDWAGTPLRSRDEWQGRPSRDSID